MTSLMDDVKRPADEYAEIRRAPLLKTAQLPSDRIADLAKQVAEAGRMLTEAREAFEETARRRRRCEDNFANVADALMQAIHEHREGTPEGVPYQP